MLLPTYWLLLLLLPVFISNRLKTTPPPILTKYFCSNLFFLNNSSTLPTLYLDCNILHNSCTKFIFIYLTNFPGIWYYFDCILIIYVRVVSVGCFDRLITLLLLLWFLLLLIVLLIVLLLLQYFWLWFYAVWHWEFNNRNRIINILLQQQQLILDILLDTLYTQLSIQPTIRIKR